MDEPLNFKLNIDTTDLPQKVQDIKRQVSEAISDGMAPLFGLFGGDGGAAPPLMSSIGMTPPVATNNQFVSAGINGMGMLGANLQQMPHNASMGVSMFVNDLSQTTTAMTRSAILAGMPTDMEYDPRMPIFKQEFDNWKKYERGLKNLEMGNTAVDYGMIGVDIAATRLGPVGIGMSVGLAGFDLASIPVKNVQEEGAKLGDQLRFIAQRTFDKNVDKEEADKVGYGILKRYTMSPEFLKDDFSGEEISSLVQNYAEAGGFNKVDNWTELRQHVSELMTNVRDASKALGMFAEDTAKVLADWKNGYIGSGKEGTFKDFVAGVVGTAKAYDADPEDFIRSGTTGSRMALQGGFNYSTGWNLGLDAMREAYILKKASDNDPNMSRIMDRFGGVEGVSDFLTQSMFGMAHSNQGLMSAFGARAGAGAGMGIMGTLGVAGDAAARGIDYIYSTKWNRMNLLQGDGSETEMLRTIQDSWSIVNQMPGLTSTDAKKQAFREYLGGQLGKNLTEDETELLYQYREDSSDRLKGKDTEKMKSALVSQQMKWDKMPDLWERIEQHLASLKMGVFEFFEGYLDLKKQAGDFLGSSVGKVMGNLEKAAGSNIRFLTGDFFDKDEKDQEKFKNDMAYNLMKEHRAIAEQNKQPLTVDEEKQLTQYFREQIDKQAEGANRGTPYLRFPFPDARNPEGMMGTVQEFRDEVYSPATSGSSVNPYRDGSAFSKTAGEVAREKIRRTGAPAVVGGGNYTVVNEDNADIVSNPTPGPGTFAMDAQGMIITPGLQLGHFNTGDFSIKRGSQKGLTRVAPNLIEALNELRDTVGKPIIINHSTRTKEYAAMLRAEGNENVATDSRHYYGDAADLKVPSGMTKDEFVKEITDSGLFSFVMTYEKSGHVHVDTRHKKGKLGTLITPEGSDSFELDKRYMSPEDLVAYDQLSSKSTIAPQTAQSLDNIDKQYGANLRTQGIVRVEIVNTNELAVANKIVQGNK